MTTTNPSLVLSTAIFGLLSLATSIGYVLKWRTANGRPHPVIDNLNQRIQAWWIMAAAIGLALLAGKTGVILLFAWVSIAALREYITLTPTCRSDYFSLLLAFFVALPFQYFLVWLEWYGLYSIFIPVYAFLTLPIAAAVSAETRGFMERTATTQWGLMLTVFAISHVPALLTLDIPGYEGRDAFLIVFLILVVQSSDVLQYVWGKLLGKHPIAPNLSPSKTLEGFIGGVGSATLLGTALYWITPFTPGEAFLISLVITLMGFFGGLVLSAIKRDQGVKDWGTLIEGHGGMLDRMDSICFSAPVFFHIVRYAWTP
jgi:phosphatidate cytidylyltransferase